MNVGATSEESSGRTIRTRIHVSDLLISVRQSSSALDPIVVPIVDPVDPIVDPIVDPFIDPFVDPVDPTVEPVDPIVDPVGPTVTALDEDAEEESVGVVMGLEESDAEVKKSVDEFPSSVEKRRAEEEGPRRSSLLTT